MACLGHLATDLSQPPLIRLGPDLDQLMAHLQLCNFHVGSPVQIWLPAWLAAFTSWLDAVNAAMHTDTKLHTCTEAVAELGWAWFICMNRVAGMVLMVCGVPEACCLSCVWAAMSLGTMTTSACVHSTPPHSHQPTADNHAHNSRCAPHRLLSSHHTSGFGGRELGEWQAFV